MKFSKLAFMLGATAFTASLLATDISPLISSEEIEEKKDSHHFYFSQEYGSLGLFHPGVGYRYQTGSYIFDVNGGYRYMKSFYYPSWHLGKIGLNAYYSLTADNTHKIYAGIGMDLVCGISRKEWGKQEKEYFFHPTLSVGHQFKIYETNKLFMEIIYTPYSFRKNKNTSLHSFAWRVGVGF